METEVVVGVDTGTVEQDCGAEGVCQYRCSVTGCHSSGQEAESDD